MKAIPPGTIITYFLEQEFEPGYPVISTHKSSLFCCPRPIYVKIFHCLE